MKAKTHSVVDSLKRKQPKPSRTETDETNTGAPATRRMIACNAAMTLAEYFGEEGGEGVMLCDFEAMHDAGRLGRRGRRRSAAGKGWSVQQLCKYRTKQHEFSRGPY